MRSGFIMACGLALACVLLPAPAGAADNAAEVNHNESQLIDVLKSDAPKQDKAITCKRLAVIGTENCVPLLAELLADPELASWARIALEAIPGPEADQALREAMADLQGRQLVGVLHSIGVRRDAQAVEPLREHLSSQDRQVVAAAAYALGRIGNAAAASALTQALDQSPDTSRSSVAEGCILCAEQLLADNQADSATELYDKVRLADVPKQRILEATRGTILARKGEGLPFLVEQLRADDHDLFCMALRTSREIPGAEVTKALVTQLPQAPPARQVMLITALAAREDGVLPAIVQAAQSGPRKVRTAAVDVLKRVGDVSCLPVLLEIAVGTQSELATTAKQTLEVLQGDDVDREIVSRLRQAEGDTRRLLIELVGLRRIDAMPALLKAAEDGDPSIRAAALVALGETVSQSDLPVLISRVASSKEADDTDVVLRALHTASVRMPDRDACVEQLYDAMSQVPTSSQVALLETIGSVGGTSALEAVASAAESNKPELQDAASQLLGRWMTTDAAPVLLDLAKNSNNRYRIRALRGYIRLARQFQFPMKQRVQMCRHALDAAERDAERVLVLEVLERYPSIGTLELAADAARVESIRDRADSAMLAIAKKISEEGIDVRQLLAHIGQSPKEIEIIEAKYGVGEQTKDVTSVIQQHVGSIPVIILGSSNYNEAFAGDPAPGTVKQLTIRYTMDGQSGEVSFDENQPIVLPLP